MIHDLYFSDVTSTNLLLFYKPLHLEAQQLSTRIEVRRHQALFWRHCRGGKVKGTHILRCECSKLFPLDSAILSFCFLFLLVRLNRKQQKKLESFIVFILS